MSGIRGDTPVASTTSSKAGELVDSRPCPKLNVDARACEHPRVVAVVSANSSLPGILRAKSN